MVYIPDDDTQTIPSVDFNQWLKRLDMNQQIKIKVPKVVETTNKKT